MRGLMMILATVGLLAGCSNGAGDGDRDPEQDPLNVAYLKITCTERGEDGRCNKATCERERDPDSPTGFEVASCAEFLVKCTAYGHDSDGDRNNATCTRAATE